MVFFTVRPLELFWWELLDNLKNKIVSDTVGRQDWHCIYNIDRPWKFYNGFLHSRPLLMLYIWPPRRPYMTIYMTMTNHLKIKDKKQHLAQQGGANGNSAERQAALPHLGDQLQPHRSPVTAPGTVWTFVMVIDPYWMCSIWRSTNTVVLGARRWKTRNEARPSEQSRENQRDGHTRFVSAQY